MDMLKADVAAMFETVALLCIALYGTRPRTTTTTAWPNNKRAEVRAHVRNCVKKTGVPGKNALRVLKGNFNDDSDEVKKFMKCMFQEVGFINEADELLDNLLIAKIRENLDDDEADELIEKCSIVGDDINDTAFQIYKCYYENHDLPPDMLV
ncbi:hypothetical protein RP20_CCG024997 [Aedes albopictus]|nr:hypothetical protein RP20_CCG024997 [Aedes albopictus]